MKWLILLSLMISCGKKTPDQVLDTNDDDGDYIVNELDQDPFVADVTQKEKINGTISVTRYGENKVLTIQRISNLIENKLANDSLLFRESQTAKKIGYFEELNRLSLSAPISEKIFDENQLYELKLSFENIPNNPTELIIRNQKIEKRVKFKKTLSISMDSNEIRSLIGPKVEFWIQTQPTNSFQQPEVQIQDSTYRIFYNSGDDLKVLYVSNRLSFDAFLEKKEISNITNIDQIFFPLIEENSIPRWWYRKLGDNDYILTKKSSLEINSIFESLHESAKDLRITRENGIVHSTFTYTKPKEGSLYIKFFASQNLRTFRTYSDTKLERLGRDDYSYYTYHYRVVSSETEQVIDQEAISENLQLWVDGQLIKIFPEALVFSPIENCWQLKIDSFGSETKLVLSSQNLNPSVPGGNYLTEIKGGFDKYNNSQPLNPESFFRIVGKVWIEKE